MKKWMMFVLIFVFVLSPAGCSNQEPITGSKQVPEDFSFALTWNCYGVSSYDSKTGKLIKTTDATNPDDYVAYYNLTVEDKQYIYRLLTELNANSYPDVYDPNAGTTSEPSMTLILTVRIDGAEKTIRAQDIAILYESKDKKGQLFLSVCQAIANRLMATEEWKALPDYENYYH